MTADSSSNASPLRPAAHKQPIDEVTAADSMIAILTELHTEKFPREERLAVDRLQASALALRLNWVSDLCRTFVNRNLEREQTNGEVSASATDQPSAHPGTGPGKWWKWARASFMAGKAS